MSTTWEERDLGISLTGGGARGSYQAGVLRAVAEILKKQGYPGDKNPFSYWSGVSAGAINATFCASGADDFDGTCRRLVNLWGQIRPQQVYCTDFKTLSKNGLKWIRDLTLGSIAKDKMAKSFLDTEPLWTLLGDNLNFAKIKDQVERKIIRGLACSAYSYTDGGTVTFLHSLDKRSWNRHRRRSRAVEMKIEHVVASCAIPLLFPATGINGEYFADGSFRNLSPISPLIHMGAKKILVVGVRGRDEISEEQVRVEPGLARVSGLILNALFFDTIDIDLERVRHINEFIDAANRDIETRRSDYSKIDYYVIRPSVDLGAIAMDKIKKFPKMISYLLGSLGPIEESVELASYILFDSEFTRELIDLGYNDVKKQEDSFMAWLAAGPSRSSEQR